MKRAVHQVEEYPGQYKVHYLSNTSTPSRVRQNAAEDGALYFDFSAEDITIKRPDPFTSLSRVPFRIPLLKGLLGLRKVIINNTKTVRFAQTNTVEDFLKLEAGQVNYWPDVLVYQRAGIKVMKSLSFNDLFPMLHANRFDYLPLGIVEVQGSLRKQTDYVDDFHIPDNIYIFYSIPIYVNTLRNTGLSSLKIIRGIEEIVENGELDVIFSEHFGEYIDSISPKSSKVFVLDNPAESKVHNQLTINNALTLYFNNQAQVFFLNE